MFLKTTQENHCNPGLFELVTLLYKDWCTNEILERCFASLDVKVIDPTSPFKRMT